MSMGTPIGGAVDTGPNQRICVCVEVAWIGYAGQYTDSNTGLIYMRARYYEPATGQFLTQDPLEAITGEPYSYANDNPINNTDPTGLDCGLTDPGGCINDAVGGVVSAGGAVAGFVASNAVPIAEGLGTVAACATPYVDVVTCPEAITGVAAINIGINDVNEYNAAINGCSVGQYLRSDGFELAVASLGLLVNTTVSIAADGLEDLPDRTAGLGTANGAVKYLNGLATGTGLAAVAAHSASGQAR
jgi:RHS repeat-associated protein